MEEKEILYQYCMDYVAQRKSRIQSEIANAQASANEETKSSAGDKYETGRAMAQLEIERNLQQLGEAEKLHQILKGINPDGTTAVVIPGALVTTTNGVFYMAISLGLITVDHKQYMIVSADSPIGKLLMGKKTGDAFMWNKQQLIIKTIQ